MIEDLWYKNTTIYSLDLETFLDADGDGVGDFEGLIDRLDYLQYLGIGTIWLAPFHPSPNRDNGYDVADYYGVDSRHGSSGDFVEFIQQAGKRGMRVLIDLVANHTSDEHRWFQEARSHPESRYRGWYVWSKERPPNWDEGVVFPGKQEGTWSYDEEAEAYYHHRFYEFQPDLNVENPQVRREIQRIIGFWLALGVSGFRVDAVPFLIGNKQPGRHNEPRHFEYLAEFRSFTQWRSGDAVLLGEANVPPGETAPYFGSGAGDGIHMMFNFWVNQHLMLALATREVTPLVAAIEATLDIPETAQWANFLRNHDELDLGRLTDEQRQTVFERFAPEESMQIFGRGIRRRMAPMLGDRKHEEAAYSVMFSLPGTPVLRYGDELRMGDDLELQGRAAVRTPMQWANKPNGGFSTAEETVHPVISDGVWGYEHVNVASQRRDPESFLNWTAQMIRVRNECPEIGCGRCRVLVTGSPHVLALFHEWRGNSVLTLHNFDENPHEIQLKPPVRAGERLSNLLFEEELVVGEGEEHSIALNSLDYRWYRVGGLDYAVRREEDDLPEEGGE
ncbi:MAG: alpha-amylase family protein [Gemmatimonadota bacterium]